MPARIALACALLLTATMPGTAAAQSRNGLKATWIGQDGKDFVGPYPEHKPNGVQDMHVRITGLPPVELRTLVIEGFGADRWVVNGPPGSWPGHWERAGKSSKADLYLEPFRRETGRAFQLKFEFADGSKPEITLNGGKADPIRRMPDVTVQAKWAGPSGEDRCGPGPSVGPDGFEDTCIDLARLAPKAEVKSLAILPEEGPGWEYGPNPRGRNNAELVRDPKDPSRGRISFQADRDLTGKVLGVYVLYADGTRDQVGVRGGPVAARKRMSGENVSDFPMLDLKAEWLGQGEQGLVRVALDRLPEGRPIAAAVLTDGVRGCWVFKADDKAQVHADYETLPLTIHREGDDGPKAELSFRPIRDESGATFTLRLIGKEGKTALFTFPGGPCDPALCAPEPASRTVAARPGDDLHALAQESGTIKLAPGTYRLDRPLILSQPVAIVGETGAVLSFSQRPESPPWTAAIKVHRGRTRLEGFTVRLDGPIRWDYGVSYGPAVIGTTDPNDPPGDWGPKVGLRLSGLDIEGPPAPRPGQWDEAVVRLMRLVSAEGGTIEGCTLRGGMVEFRGGPWTIRDNLFRGTLPGTWSHDIFGGHSTHDLVLTGNKTDLAPDSGKTWRLLVLTQRGSNDLVARNETRGLGPREGDPVPNVNAPETIITESYRLHFEGKPTGISPDGRTLVIPDPPGGAALTGSTIAILSGEKAGTWHRILHAVDPRTYRVDPPLPSGDYAVSLATGFVNETFEGNTIDARGSTQSFGFVFGGNHFGTKIVDNKILGGALSFRLTATGTEAPNHWGWSHAPFLGAVIRGNTFAGAAQGAKLGVDHGSPIKSSKGRVYFSGEFIDNRLTSDGGPRRREGPPVALQIGDAGSLDPHELRLTERGTTGSPGLLKRVEAAALNGKPVTDRDIPVAGPAPR